MATIAAVSKDIHTEPSWTLASQSYEVPCGTESRAAEVSVAERLRLWREGSLYIKRITTMPTTPHVELSPYLDLARRRALWNDVTPVALVFAIFSGIVTASFGQPVMLCVMAGVFVATATVGRLVWPS